MSKRESIAANIITTLSNSSDDSNGDDATGLKKITRQPFKPEEIANRQFPAMFVSTGDEVREDLSLGEFNKGKRKGTIDYVLVGYVKGSETNLDTKRNALIEFVEETLDEDRTRGGNALETKIIEVSSDEGTLFPFGGVKIVVRVLYEYTRGTT